MTNKPMPCENISGSETEILISQQLVKKINAFLNVMLSLAISLTLVALTVAMNLQ